MDQACSDDLVVNPGRSEITFPANVAGIYSRNQIAFNKVTFPNTQGNGFLASRLSWQNDDFVGTLTASNVQFNGNGRTFGHLVTDTLVGVAGKVYTFDSERTVDVSSYLQLRGNNCTSIELRSSANAVKATVEMPSTAEVVVDFVQMNDMIGTGGADFNAGSRSVNVGNSNVGWIFEDAPDFIESGFLGEDRAICQDEPVDLLAFSYSPNEIYLWSTGSMDSLITVDEAGEYFVQVQFESNCILRDTITIVDAEVFEAELPDNSNICTAGSIILNAEVDFEDANYLWSDGSTESSLEVNNPGTYYIEIEALGCSTFDSTIVEFVEDPGDFLPADTSICDGSSIILTASLPGEEHQWHDQTNDENWIGSEEGIKWLDLTIDGCVYRDSILLSTLESPVLELGGDTTICDNQSLVINLQEDYNYLWQDGNTSSEYAISAAGKYILSAELNNCLATDSFEVALKASPMLDLGDDYSVCESEEVVLTVPELSTNFTWDDGSNESERNIEDSGIYWLEVEEDGCYGSDTVVVDFISLPMIDLGDDIVVCEQNVNIIEPIAVSNGDLTWQDGTKLETYEVLSPGLITATVFDGLCENVDSILVNFKDCIFFDIYIPNAFSPNDDGENDVFEVFVPEELIVDSYSMDIYDRWGNLCG